MHWKRVSLVFRIFDLAQPLPSSSYCPVAYPVGAGVAGVQCHGGRSCRAHLCGDFKTTSWWGKVPLCRSIPANKCRRNTKIRIWLLYNSEWNNARRWCSPVAAETTGERLMGGFVMTGSGWRPLNTPINLKVWQPYVTYPVMWCNSSPQS